MGNVFTGAGTAFLLSGLYLYTAPLWSFSGTVLRSLLGLPPAAPQGMSGGYFALVTPAPAPLLVLGFLCLTLGLLPRRGKP